MPRLVIPEAPIVAMGLQDEIRRSEEARYDHRLHAVLLVAQGMSCPQAAQLLGDSPRTVQFWVNRFLNEGLPGLRETPRPGRPPILSDEQVEQINRALRLTPEECGLAGHLWDGKILSEFIQKRFDVHLGVRQCQRLFHHLGFRLRKPRGTLAGADLQAQEAFKKNSRSIGIIQR